MINNNIIINKIFKNMPSPNNNEINDISFNAIWDIIKSWDINIPEYYNGYCGANGSHVKLILDNLNEKKCLINRKKKLERILKKIK
jgi:hypothetical protein